MKAHDVASATHGEAAGAIIVKLLFDGDRDLARSTYRLNKNLQTLAKALELVGSRYTLKSLPIHLRMAFRVDLVAPEERRGGRACPPALEVNISNYK